MNTPLVTAEAHFKKAASKAILTIIFFAVAYFTLLALSLVFAAVCGYAGLALISFKPNALTLGLGLGTIVLGVIVFVFLVKFLFKKHVVDRSHLTELREEDAPLLYQEIREMVDQVHTSFPKKIYLSNDVNAAVFYDSTFLSLFFPVKKNLQIGLGLVNSVSKDELRAILAHEFGHFSQRSMKVGSYVYTVNQIIFNMLYDNDGYNRSLEGLSRFSYFSIFTWIGVKIVQGIQWILVKLYSVVNIHHLELSREMEFHADAVAAKTVGSKAFISSLLRLDLANQSYNQVLSYYEKKITEKIRPTNVYPQQHFVMNLLATEADLKIVNGLPQVTLQQMSRYNKSKLTIKDQWASHPSTFDRIAAIKKQNFEEGEDKGLPASDFFNSVEELQKRVTEVLFVNVDYQGKPSEDSFQSFKEEFLRDRKVANFPKLFNGYYDYHNPVKIDLESSAAPVQPTEIDAFFADDRVDLIYTLAAVKGDIAVLKDIALGQSSIKSFEYDGEKYLTKEVEDLVTRLEVERNDLEATIATGDLNIFHYFRDKAQLVGCEQQFKEKYLAYIAFDSEYDAGYELYAKVANEISFVQYTTPFEQIETNFRNFRKTEGELKDSLRSLLAKNDRLISANDRAVFETYLKEELKYFIHSVYKEENLEILYSALRKLQEVLNENYVVIKGAFLREMEALEDQKSTVGMAYKEEARDLI